MLKSITAAVILAIFTFYGSNAQESSKAARSNLESAYIRTGVLIKREYKPIATFRDVDFHKISIEDVINKTHLRGLQIIYGGVKKSVVFVDNDELKTLAKSLEMVRDKRMNPEENVDYKFACRGGLEMTFTWVKDRWGAVIDLSHEGVTKEIMIVELSDLVKLINIFNAASI